jgi:hypothetical protein
MDQRDACIHRALDGSWRCLTTFAAAVQTRLSTEPVELSARQQRAALLVLSRERLARVAEQCGYASRIAGRRLGTWTSTCARSA